jgi:molecular chaperone DnaK
MAELALARNSADGLVHSTRKSMTEYGDKLDEADKTAIEAALKDVEDALKDNADKAAIDAKVEALGTASQKLGEKMYAEAQAAQAASGAAGAGPEGGAGGAAGGGSKPVDDNVVDADFKEVKRDSK